MNIHEIITAWEDDTLPTDLPALAAAQNKVDDYLKKAHAGAVESSKHESRNMYEAEVYCYSVVSGTLQQLIDKAIPDPVNKVKP